MQKHFLTITLSLCFLSPAFVYSKERVALVIGNSNYTHLSTLKNPLADATAVAKRLKGFGFSLIHPIHSGDVQYDLDEDQLITARDALSEAAAGAKIAFLYYSGHGASLGKRLEAHILPINVVAPEKTATSLNLLKRHSLSLDHLLAGLDQKAELTVAVFDACREIPELEQVKGISDGGLWRGLRVVKRGRKRIIAYSGAQGQIVADGAGQYSPYTQRLLEVLDNRPTLEVGNLFREVATKVESYTGQIAEVLIQGVPPNRYYLQTGTRHEFALTINPTPATAKIRILNIIPKYQQGMLLKPSNYKIEVSQQGYFTKTQWIALGKADKTVDIVLTKKTQPFAHEPEMVFIRGGRFQMGSPANEKGRLGNEKQHWVTVGDFWMAKTETTFEQWQACVDDGGCQSNTEPNDNGWGRGNRPVINVSWHDANEYAQWLSKKTGKNYRLPTEAQWEYAARGGSSSRFHFGNNEAELCVYANHADKSVDYPQRNTKCSDGIGKQTAPVKHYKPNQYGLYDMMGNVYEWTCSAYNKNYNGSENKCIDKNEFHSPALRSGSWFLVPRYIRLAYRNDYSASDRHKYIGFRLSKTR